VTDKRIHFLVGLPRSGSTLLSNILLQNPKIHVTPTSGILDMLTLVRGAWDRSDSFRAAERTSSETAKQDVMRAMLHGYFQRVDRPVCIDKNRYWAEALEMAAGLVGGRDRVRVLVSVRDMRDVLASFEQLYRTTSEFGEVHIDPSAAIKFKTAQGRVDTLLDAAQPVGRAYIAVRDALTRGWLPNMHFVEYEDLTSKPKQTLDGVYRFLGVQSCVHDFQRVEQVTFEDDFIYGFKDLHRIRQEVKPQPSKWKEVFDDSVFKSASWKDVEAAATFWRSYVKPSV
jgi:sulfotransferase